MRLKHITHTQLHDICRFTNTPAIYNILLGRALLSDDGQNIEFKVLKRVHRSISEHTVGHKVALGLRCESVIRQGIFGTMEKEQDDKQTSCTIFDDEVIEENILPFKKRLLALD